jgi:hypothetical protein
MITSAKAQEKAESTKIKVAHMTVSQIILFTFSRPLFLL